VKVEDAHSQRAELLACMQPVSLESMALRTLSALATHALRNAIRWDEALTEGRYRIRQSDANLNLPYTSSQRCIPGDASQSDQNVDIAHKMSIAAHAPVVSAGLDGSDASARQAMPAIHFDPLKWTTPFKPLLSASYRFLDVTERSMPLSANMLQGSAGNVFPYGQCTWWANQRYHQLHGSFVPWRTNANAFQWANRAREYGWHVSGTPTVGSIIVLQPNVDGAYGLGHVGVVEQILTDGRVMASSMNWGKHPSMVTENPYVLGPGVSFINPTSV
jgi:surface antigen